MDDVNLTGSGEIGPGVIIQDSDVSLNHNSLSGEITLVNQSFDGKDVEGRAFSRDDQVDAIATPIEPKDAETVKYDTTGVDQSAYRAHIDEMSAHAYLAFFLAFVPGGLSSIGFAVPVWLMWYLVGLMAWRIILEIIRPWFEARPWRCVGIALAVGMLAGFDLDAGYVLSWSRTVAFLPYYLAGAACRRTGRHPAETMARLGRRKYFIAIAGPAVTALSAWVSGSLPVAALYGSTPYGGWGWAAVRFCQYVSALPMTAALFVLVPSGSGWLRRTGRRSLYVYLAHGIPVKLLGRVMDGLPLAGLPGGCALAGSFVLAAAVSSVCAGRTAGELMRPLTVPPWERDGK